MIELAVVRFATGWKIFSGQMWMGRYDYEVDAVDAALRMADLAVRRGQAAKVLVKGPFGEMQSLPPRSG